ncbi:hypothetical protein PROFUN_15608 [Planoprotostelium fungivorum]|uniref:Uncharacterized protein n=1 Tax=Planoprotostelium fungivorum TaxID=1890364 RepID=A0A2P6MYL8_9EUKA|nr:hypothetical protein PROFUN_15608 [Planoprotostelium fungivorum]
MLGQLSRCMTVFGGCFKQVMSEKVGGHSLPNETPTTNNKYVADNGCQKATGPGYSVSYNYQSKRPNGSTSIYKQLLFASFTEHNYKCFAEDYQTEHRSQAFTMAHQLANKLDSKLSTIDSMEADNILELDKELEQLLKDTKTPEQQLLCLLSNPAL